MHCTRQIAARRIAQHKHVFGSKTKQRRKRIRLGPFNGACTVVGLIVHRHRMALGSHPKYNTQHDSEHSRCHACPPDTRMTRKPSRRKQTIHRDPHHHPLNGPQRPVVRSAQSGASEPGDQYHQATVGQHATHALVRRMTRFADFPPTSHTKHHDRCARSLPCNFMRWIAVRPVDMGNHTWRCGHICVGHELSESTTNRGRERREEIAISS